ncbi:MAG: hypothetical protein IT342_20230 [Candidatus Melainabacteria bacterium]|nr:hypothetical protein [Candidatus Melainabacteria bacterium]
MNNHVATTHIGNQVSRIRRSSTESFLKAVVNLDQVSHDQVMNTIVSLYPAFEAPVASSLDGTKN